MDEAAQQIATVSPKWGGAAQQAAGPEAPPLPKTSQAQPEVPHTITTRKYQSSAQGAAAGDSLRGAPQAGWDPSTEGAKHPHNSRSQKKNARRAHRRRAHRAARGPSTSAPGEDTGQGAREAVPPNPNVWQEWRNKEYNRQKQRHQRSEHTGA